MRLWLCCHRDITVEDQSRVGRAVANKTSLYAQYAQRGRPPTRVDAAGHPQEVTPIGADFAVLP
jgi:hypothetical protein